MTIRISETARHQQQDANPFWLRVLKLSLRNHGDKSIRIPSRRALDVGYFRTLLLR